MIWCWSRSNKHELWRLLSWRVNKLCVYWNALFLCCSGNWWVIWVGYDRFLLTTTLWILLDVLLVVSQVFLAHFLHDNIRDIVLESFWRFRVVSVRYPTHAAATVAIGYSWLVLLILSKTGVVDLSVVLKYIHLIWELLLLVMLLLLLLLVLLLQLLNVAEVIACRRRRFRVPLIEIIQ